MKTIFYLFAFSLLAGCNHLQKHFKVQDSKFSSLLNQYKDISFDTLKVFSSDNNYADTFKYKGEKIDSILVSLFPKTLAGAYAPGEDFFACFKFPLDSSRIGLITRTPSTYQSSSIKLLVFDKDKDSITQVLELSEMVGDAGDFFIKESWIMKDKNGSFQTFGWIEEGHDNSVENEKDTTTTTNNLYYLLNLSKDKIDTVSKDKKMLTAAFGSLMKGKVRVQ